MASIELWAKPIIAGEKMSREEFLGRWDLLPDLKFAELIDGTVYMPSPLSVSHGSSDNLLAAWAGVYTAHTPGCQALNNATFLMLRDVPQPDVSLRIRPEYGGQSSFRGILAAGAPELAVEVCLTTGAHDLGPKKDLYEKAGVREYLVLVLDPPQLLCHRLQAGRFHLVGPDPDAIFRSAVFPGLWLDSKAILAGDAKQLLDTLQRGTSTPEHEAFRELLASRTP